MSGLMVFVRLMRPARGWVLLGAGLTLLTLLSGIALLGIAGWFTAAAAQNPLVLATLALSPVAAIRFLAILRVVSRYGDRLATHEATFRVLAGLRLWFFARIQPLAPSQLGALRSGDLLNRITADIDALDTLYLRILVPTGTAALAGLLIFGFLSLYSPALALTALGFGLAAGLAVPAWAERQGRSYGQDMNRILSDLRAGLVDTVQGLPELLSYGAADATRARIRRLSDRLLSDRLAMGRITGIANGATVVLTQTAVLATLLIGVALMGGGHLNGPAVVLMTFCVLAAFEAVAPLGPAFQYLGRTRAAGKRLLDLATARPLVLDPPASRSTEIASVPGFMLEAVSFAYPARDGAPERDAAVHAVTLAVAPGRKVGLVGHSGSGKSTLLALMMRLYDADEGTVRLGGVPVRELAQNDIWSRIGFLSQHTELFCATVRDNILLGKPHADDAAVRRAARIAGLEPFLARQPDGLETWVGEGGLLVSGGEARRIALARVILKDAPILLLDEPTEGLDRETAREVLDALTETARDKTVVMVSHRPAYLEAMDEIYVLDQGRIIDGGPADTVRAESEAFRRLGGVDLV